VISLELPGKIMEHNADEQVGSRLTWEIDLFETLDGSAAIPFAKANISMTSESTGSGGLRILWIIIGVVAGVLVLASLKFLQYQRDRDTEEDIL